MPQHYFTRPATLERLRCSIVRFTLRLALGVLGGSVRMLPTGHPVRIFVSARLPELREVLLPACVRSSRIADRNRRLWMGPLLLVVLVLANVAVAASDGLELGLPG